MKTHLQLWARAFLLVVLVLGTSPLHAAAEPRVALQETANVVAGTEACCGTEVPGGHAAECLTLCSTGGQMVLPASIELPVASTQGLRPEPRTGADNRFPDLEPDPPRRSSRTT